MALLFRAMGGGARDVACRACTTAGDNISIAFDRPGSQVQQSRSPTHLSTHMSCSKRCGGAKYLVTGLKSRNPPRRVASMYLFTPKYITPQHEFYHGELLLKFVVILLGRGRLLS
jgi:hypothetical protein